MGKQITYKLHLRAKVVPYIGIIIAKWIITGDLLALLGKLSHQTAKKVQNVSVHYKTKLIFL